MPQKPIMRNKRYDIDKRHAYLPFHFLNGFLCERMNVSKSNIKLMWSWNCQKLKNQKCPKTLTIIFDGYDIDKIKQREIIRSLTDLFLGWSGPGVWPCLGPGSRSTFWSVTLPQSCCIVPGSLGFSSEQCVDLAPWQWPRKKVEYNV